MPGSGRAEIYFIVGMMILIVILSVVAVIAFFKTYKKEMKHKSEQESGQEKETAPPVEKAS